MIHSSSNINITYFTLLMWKICSVRMTASFDLRLFRFTVGNNNLQSSICPISLWDFKLNYNPKTRTFNKCILTWTIKHLTLCLAVTITLWIAKIYKITWKLFFTLIFFFYFFHFLWTFWLFLGLTGWSADIRPADTIINCRPDRE